MSTRKLKADELRDLLRKKGLIPSGTKSEMLAQFVESVLGPVSMEESAQRSQGKRPLEGSQARHAAGDEEEGGAEDDQQLAVATAASLGSFEFSRPSDPGAGSSGL